MGVHSVDVMHRLEWRWATDEIQTSVPAVSQLVPSVELHGVGACLPVCPGPCELMSLRDLVPLRGWGEEVHSPHA